jgi:hypothetical protein
MSGQENKLVQLTRLMENGTLARSACSREFLATLAPLLDSGIVTEEKSGAGRCFVVHNAEAFRNFIQHHFPNVSVPAGASSRLAAVSRFRDTKAIASDLPEIVTLRSWDDGSVRCDGKSIASATSTRTHGVFAFLLRDASRFTLHGPCALVENPAAFTEFEHLRLPSRLAIYGHGRSSNRLLHWVSNQTAPDFQLLHLPDYDPVGLDEFTRLRERLGPRVQLHLPANLADLFQHHANVDLLQKPSTQLLLAKLRQSQIAEVRTVLALIEKHNAGLEQEALLIETL